MFLWNCLALSVTQLMLTIWSLVPLPLQNTACTSGSSSVHILLKSSLKDFEHYPANMWHEHNCIVVPLVLPFLEIGMKTDLFQSCGYCWIFQICWHTECSTLTASSFRIWNSSTGIPSPPLALFLEMLPKPPLTSCSRMSGCRWVTTPSWLSESLRTF